MSNSTSTYFDLAFTVRAMKPIPVDHGYALYGAISRWVPEAHRENGIAVHPIRGQQVGERLLSLRPWSSLTIRVPDGEVAPLLSLAGKTLRLGETALQVGVPQVRGLVPATERLTSIFWPNCRIPKGSLARVTKDACEH